MYAPGSASGSRRRLLPAACAFSAFVLLLVLPTHHPLPRQLALEPRKPLPKPSGSTQRGRLSPADVEARRQRRESVNKVLMSVATAAILTTGAVDVELINRQTRENRLEGQRALESHLPSSLESLPAPPLIGTPSSSAREWSDFAFLQEPFALLAVPVLVILGSALWTTFTDPAAGIPPSGVSEVNALDPPALGSEPLPPQPPTREPSSERRPLPLVDTPVSWGYVPKQREVFSIASGVALTVTLQMAGQLGEEGVLGYAVPFCYGTALATLYGAVCQAAMVHNAKQRRPLRVLITGSTRGVGKALAREFLQRGDRVVITSRSNKSVEAALGQLRREVPGCLVLGTASDVSDGEDVQRLADFAVGQLGGVDLWVNNAGTISRRKDKLVDLTQQEIQETVKTNLIGSLLCTQAALRLMRRQGSGHIFNMDGAGATGDATPLYATYGASKAALVQLTKTLCAENQGSGVGVHLLSPGMVITDLLLTGASPENLRAFNILAELPENVAAWLVPRMRNVAGSGHYVRYLTNQRVVGRLLTFPLRWDRFFKDGQPVYLPETERLQARARPTDTSLEIQNLAVAYALSMASMFWTMSKLLGPTA